MKHCTLQANRRNCRRSMFQLTVIQGRSIACSVYFVPNGKVVREALHSMADRGDGQIRPQICRIPRTPRGGSPKSRYPECVAYVANRATAEVYTICISRKLITHPQGKGSFISNLDRPSGRLHIWGLACCKTGESGINHWQKIRFPSRKQVNVQ